MEEEPAEHVTTHHKSGGKEGPQGNGWRDEEDEEELQLIQDIKSL